MTLFALADPSELRCDEGPEAYFQFQTAGYVYRNKKIC